MSFWFSISKDYHNKEFSAILRQFILEDFRRLPVRFINKPLSNIDLLQWVTQLGIKYFRGIYSRDNLPQKIHKLETEIINLDDSMGGGSHWVCYRSLDKQYCEY